MSSSKAAWVVTNEVDGWMKGIKTAMENANQRAHDDKLAWTYEAGALKRSRQGVAREHNGCFATRAFCSGMTGMAFYPVKKTPRQALTTLTKLPATILTLALITTELRRQRLPTAVADDTTDLIPSGHPGLTTVVFQSDLHPHVRESDGACLRSLFQSAAYCHSSRRVAALIYGTMWLLLLVTLYIPVGSRHQRGARVSRRPIAKGKPHADATSHQRL